MDVRELFEKLKPVLGSRFDSLWKLFLEGDSTHRRYIKRSLEFLYDEKFGAFSNHVVMTPPMTQSEISGDIPIGSVVYAQKTLYPFCLLESELSQHVGVFGRTGAGKSFFVHNLVKQVSWLGIACVVFDWKNSTRVVGEERVIRLGDKREFFRFNPLDVSRFHPDLRLGITRRAVELFLESYLNPGLLTTHGVEFLLLRGIEEIENPTFHKLYAWLRTFKGTTLAGWKTTLLSLLYKLNSGSLGNVYNKADGESFDFSEFLHGVVRFELQGIGSSRDKQFFITTFLLHLMSYVESLGSTSRLRVLVVLEEAHHVLRNTSESVVELMIRQVREYGVGVVIVDQHPSLLSLPALGTFCTVSFNLSSEPDRLAMSSSLNLDDSSLLGRLENRFAIVKIQNRFLTPFLIKTFDVGVDSSSVVSRGFPVENPSLDDSKQSLPIELVGTDKERFLQYVFDYPVIGTTDLYCRLSLSDYRGNILKNELLGEGCLYVEPVIVKGVRLKFLTLTRKGCRVLGGDEFGNLGGMFHQFWVRRIAGRFERLGLNVEVERRIDEFIVDVVVRVGDSTIGIEIETGSNKREQIEKNVAKSMGVLDSVVVLWLSNSTIDFDVVKSEKECVEKVMSIGGIC